METISSRLKILRKHLGINQTQLAEIIEAGEPVIKALEQGKTKNIKPKYLVILEKKLNLNREWLEYGKGDIFLNNNRTILKDILKIEDALNPESITIPYYEDIKASAGDGYTNSEFTKSTIQLNQKILPAKSDKIDAIRVYGDSMKGTIEDTDIIFVDKNAKELINGKIYVVLVENDVFVKRIFKDIAHDKMILKSDNPIYPQFDVSASDFRIIGKVIASMCIKNL